MEPLTVPTQEPDQPITVPQDVAPVVPPPPEVTAVRAEKAYIGLGGDRQAIHNQIMSGQEQELRIGAASSLIIEASMKKERDLVDAYTRKGSPLSYQEALKLVDPFNPENTPADPKDVIERAYATKYVSAANTADAFMRDTAISDAQKEIPEVAADKERLGTELTTKLEVAKTLKQNLDAEIANQG